MRILVAGGPRTGKTAIALQLGAERACRVRHTDDLIGQHSWSDASALVAEWMDEPGPWIIEGVSIPRALRKWIGTHPHGLPADVLYWGEAPKVPLTPGQRTMSIGCASVWLEVKETLITRGMRVTVF